MARKSSLLTTISPDVHLPSLEGLDNADARVARSMNVLYQAFSAAIDNDKETGITFLLLHGGDGTVVNASVKGDADRERLGKTVGRLARRLKCDAVVMATDAWARKDGKVTDEEVLIIAARVREGNKLIASTHPYSRVDDSVEWGDFNVVTGHDAYARLVPEWW